MIRRALLRLLGKPALPPSPRPLPRCIDCGDVLSIEPACRGGHVCLRCATEYQMAVGPGRRA